MSVPPTPIENIKARLQEVRTNVKTRIDEIKTRLGIASVQGTSSPNVVQNARKRIEAWKSKRVKVMSPNARYIAPTPQEPKSFEADLLDIPRTVTETPISTVNKKLYV